MGHLKMLWLLAIRNLFSHRVKSLIVGTIMFFGTFLIIVGTSLLDSVETSMSEGITKSIGGHLQVYSADAKDELALYGGGFMGAEDIGRIDAFSKLRATLQKDPNVKAVVPMGLDLATVTAPGELDRALATLRNAVNGKDEAAIPALKEQIGEIAAQMTQEYTNAAEIAADQKRVSDALALLSKVTAPGFWEAFEADRLGTLEFLDTKVAPLTEDGRLIYFRYLGTDLDLYVQHFEKFEVVKGVKVPPFERGFLFNDKFYEDWVKHLIARNLDQIKRQLDEGKTIAEDPLVQAKAKRLRTQYKRITYQLDAKEAKRLEAELSKAFRMEQDENPRLADRVQNFLTIDDKNFAARYAYFYDVIAPMIDLYDVDVGDTMTIRAFTRSGFLKAVNIKVYGTFKFVGLEKSDLAGSHSLMDLVSFRELYGLMTEAKKKELAGIKEEVGLEDVSRSDAEDALFGGSNPIDEAVSGDGFDEFEDVSLAAAGSASDVFLKFNQAQLDEGMVLNAAVVLKDSKNLSADMSRIDAKLKSADLNMKVVDWKQATGMIGQSITLIRAVLIIAALIIFIVAIVIINNSMVMATMERVTEIGTMRAIGAQRNWVLIMFLLETVVLGFVAGVLGSVVGGAAVTSLGSVGIPAVGDVMVFFFGGPRLFPTIGISNMVMGLVAILIVSLISTLYPAYLATRVQPIMAMRAKE